jgi:hypothetical protein
LLPELHSVGWCSVGADITALRTSWVPRSKNRPLGISDAIGCDTQMASSVTANLLDDGVVDTLESVGVRSGIHTSASINASDSAQILRAALREACQQMRVTRDDGNRLQKYEWPGDVRELRNVIERAVILSKSPPSRCTPTPRYDGRSPMEWRRLVSRRMSRKARNGERAPPRRRCASRIGMDCAP